MTDMPTTYESRETTTTTSSGGGTSDIRFRVDYLKTIPGILKIVEVILSLITFICSCVWWWGGSQSWVQFVSISAFLSVLVYLVLHVINLISRFPGPWLLIEFIYYCVFTLFFLIAAIVAAVRGSWHPSIGATAFFAFVATAVFAADTFFQFRAWRSGQTEMTASSTTTTHTTTTTATVSKEAY